ncbi:MAG TPA: lipopolysaccharide assembly protein LapA domain-containing protein [Xanthomonadaceae bacterium]|jgi:putative membrane protein|nr:lipopolysaccharide assembly protein LapA domain-containing protein [Xanthomonadaceae bacterium]
MRVLLQILMAVLFVAAGVLFGAFNPQAVAIDFHAFQVPASLGVALLMALLLGAALGGVAVMVGIVWPLRRRVRKLAREAASAQSSGQPHSTSSA